MKKLLRWTGVIIVLLVGAFGAGWYIQRIKVEEMAGRLQEAQKREEAARVELARARLGVALYRAAREAGKLNFGNAAAQLGQAQEMVKVIPELSASMPSKITELLSFAQKLDSSTKQRVEALIEETQR